MEDQPEVEQEITKEEVIEPYKTIEERNQAITEVNMLCNMINTSYFYLHFDNGNNGKQEPKVTKSTQISVFSAKDIESMVGRIMIINKKLNAK